MKRCLFGVSQTKNFKKEFSKVRMYTTKSLIGLTFKTATRSYCSRARFALPQNEPILSFLKGFVKKQHETLIII